MSTPFPGGKALNMILLRRAARPMLASVFVFGGLDAWAHPGHRAVLAKPVTDALSTLVPALPRDPEQLVRINAAVQVVAGTSLALGRFPRLSALALAASVVLTTAAGHRFWEETEAKARSDQRIHFLKNVSSLGGLLLATADTEGKPSLGWRAHHAAGVSRHALRASKREAEMAAREAKLSAKNRVWKTKARLS